MVTMVVSFERTNLFDDVWTEPLSVLAARYGVSAAEVRRAARAMEIPMPPAWHWRKVADGQGAVKPSLPDTDAPVTHRHSWYVSDEDAEIDRRLAVLMPQHTLPMPPLPAQAQSLQECLPLIRQMSAQLKKGQKDMRSWPVVSGSGLFELAVAPENQMRALVTMDRLLRHCVASGLKLVADERASLPATFLVHGHSLTFRIFEAGRQEERELTAAERKKLDADPQAYIYGGRYIYRPTNCLRLEVKVPRYRWTEFTLQDGFDAPLAERISDVPAKMLRAALRMRVRDEVRAEESQRAEQARRTLVQRRAVKEAELAKLAEFEDWAQRMERAARLRSLANALEHANAADAFGGPDQMRWLRDAADWLDPTVLRSWPEVDEAG